MGYAAKVLADSVSPDGVRLTSMEVSFPRIVLAEFNTHRVFSRNSASSRAIPVKKMLEKVETDPFIPVFWGKNQKGMQAAEELDVAAQTLALNEWLYARDGAVQVVKRLQDPDIDLHKQIANRILEPWLFHTVIVTSTEWDNFWGLRCNKDAQPEIRKIAEMMRVAYDRSTSHPLDYGHWHLPLIDGDELFDMQVGGMLYEEICKVSVGRCARVSYLTHDGKRDLQADIDLYDRLLKSGHLSPFEHVARPMTREEAESILMKSGVVAIDTLDIDVSEVFNGNFRGFTQLRKTLSNEAVFVPVTGA